MCGIVGIIGTQNAAPRLYEALKRLEYRGYDSAGIAVLNREGTIERRRAEGKLQYLADVLADRPLDGLTGIGHTRWATHGAPVQRNAHPLGTSAVSVVHNGIIENHAALRAELEGLGQVFETETDTETVAQLLDWHLAQGATPEQAAQQTFGRLEGAFALVAMFAGHGDLMIGIQSGAPLAVGFGDDEMYVGSDALALAPLTRQIAYLHDGDWVIVTRNSARFFDAQNRPIDREIRRTAVSGAAIGKAGFRHYMEKELYEHPAVIGDTLQRWIDPGSRTVVLPDLPVDPARIARVTLAACGSAYYAGLVGKWWLESIARLPVDADVASELRYRDPPYTPGSVGLLVSQSGETADTMAALRALRAAGQPILSVVNVPESTMARESDAVLETVAGPEIGVASTKAYTAQLSVLACLAIGVARARGQIDAVREGQLTDALLRVPGAAAHLLSEQDGDVQQLARLVAGARDVLYLGRGAQMPIAQEGALKLKEISYIHAEAYAAGEMKHGPIALIDQDVPIIGLCPSGPLFEKTASNLQEAAARGGKIILLSDRAGCEKLHKITAACLCLPDIDPFVAPILYAVPVQMLAYHVAVLKGTDVDQPRNLAKSVTVE